MCPAPDAITIVALFESRPAPAFEDPSRKASGRLRQSDRGLSDGHLTERLHAFPSPRPDCP